MKTFLDEITTTERNRAIIIALFREQLHDIPISYFILQTSPVKYELYDKITVEITRCHQCTFEHSKAKRKMQLYPGIYGGLFRGWPEWL